MSTKMTAVLLLLQLSSHFDSGSCGKVLVWTMEFSHWINMKAILEELTQRGHEVTVLKPSGFFFVDGDKSSAIKFESYPSLASENEERYSIESFNVMIYEMPKQPFWKYFSTFQEIMSLHSDIVENICRDAVLNQNLMAKLQEAKFDVVLSDAICPCGRPTTLSETAAKADFWLIRTYWDLEFPRPSLPNVDFVGGLHCRPAKPLPKEMEDFVQSSGENGVVVFSLGSLVGTLNEERANVIASALAQIPQKVLWRFDGKKPDTLGPNTRLFKWIPQRDLLGHPKTKAFITHGGTNGIYEAIYHGIPMVGIPLFADQYDSISHMKIKGAAVRLDFNTMSSTDLLKALNTVIKEPSYKENAMRLSRIHHDQPVKPLDRAVFWIEFVMRHKGAKHLRIAAHDLSWFQYYSLDVVGFLLACVVTVIFIITKCCLFCCQMFAKTGKKKKGE
ncbi:UDP-glucuronosyltransferase 2B9-like isoform X2 [Sciurus carolinensis]|uniref:UDP-glucuronosyltransferase 2B9-like isoform X2 n=1 Tax=Sciurus carolinensis TaxID=30640 RepID=UPI001FB4B6E0|nr:UDP-glucuronosyltransferase 2B9-like isoform X2 [Sciurus carolinensis]